MFKQTFITALILTIFLSAAAVAFAAAGDLDPSFGGDGIVSTPIPNELVSGASDIVIQPDGKSVVSVLAHGLSDFDLAVFRYNVDGTLDTTFSGDGVFTTPFGSDDADTATAIALQSDGKILVTGTLLTEQSSSFVVLRLNTDGTLDTSFDNDGIVLHPVFDLASGRSISVQGDGKILVAGNAFSGNEDYLAVIRLNTDGSLDTTFGNNGRAAISFGLVDLFYDMTLQPDGKIVLLGDADASSGNAFLAIVRFNSNGTRDNTFDGDGVSATRIEGLTGKALATQADGKILVGGSLFGDSAVLRFNSNGSPDNGFDSDGIAIASFGDTSDATNNLIVQPDGKIVAAGEIAIGDNLLDLDIAVARLNSNGSLDPTFGVGGKVVTRVSGESDLANAVALQSDGKIVVAGAGTELGSRQVTLVRYLNQTAANVSVRGRVTRAGGRGVQNARIVMADQNGNVRYAISNPFGYYRFADVLTGQSYTLSVSAKQRTFEQPTRVIAVGSSDLTDVDFIAEN